MNANLIALIVLLFGIALTVFGAVVLVTHRNREAGKNSFKVFGLFEFQSSTAGLSVMAMGIAIILALGVKFSVENSDPIDTKGVDAALIGSWEGSTQYNGVDVNIFYDFMKSSFAVKYTHSEYGSIGRVQDGLRFIGSPILRSVVKLTNDGADKMTALMDGIYYHYTRSAGTATSQNLSLGQWETDIPLLGVNCHFVLEIAPTSYKFSFEGKDDGPFSAANGEYQMTSRWATQPIEGAYKILSPDSISLRVVALDWIQFHKSR